VVGTGRRSIPPRLGRSILDAWTNGYDDEFVGLVVGLPLYRKVKQVSELRKVERVEASHPALQVSRQLLEYLLTSGNISVGDRLPSERELASTFGVGRSAVREALKSLSLLGLLEIRQGDGTYLRKGSSTFLPQVIQWGMLLDKQHVENLLDARRAIEIGLAELAAIRRTDDDVEDLSECIRQLKLAMKDSELWVGRDVAFHLQVAQAAHSDTLSDVLYRLRSLLDMSISHNQAQATDNLVKFREHERIFLGIRDQDPREASEAMREHMDRVAARLRTPEKPANGGSKRERQPGRQGPSADDNAKD
jgi:GntR family transcriptional regulator, transcriptional repressor for pyruvate dehydrogenase complex